MKSHLLKLCAVLVIIASNVWAQSEASLSGTVSDSSGAVLPNALVKLTSSAQGTARTVLTNGSGVYQFSFLPPGIYSLEVSAAGFKALTSKDLTLAVAENARRDYKLELGNVSENVTVSAAVESVNTDNAQLGAVVDNTKVTEMPLNSRTFFSLAVLAPGVVPPVQGSSMGSRGDFNVAGSPETDNSFILNGFDNNDSVKQVPNFRPSIDAIQEFNVLTGIFPAEYGYASGGQVVVTTKSGENTFHGTGFEFLRNQDALTARNFFAAPGPIPAFRRNQFGGVFGGPIKKDKTFFFGSYEGQRQTQDANALVTTPTTAMTTGDFSAIVAKQIIKDPTTGSPFPGNIIPQNRISPMGELLASYFHPPTYQTPVGLLPTNNQLFDSNRYDRNNSSSLKLDHYFTAKDSAFATANYYVDDYITANDSCANYLLPGGNSALFKNGTYPTCNVGQKSQVYGIAETHIFSASMVNDFRVGYEIYISPVVDQDNATQFWPMFGLPDPQTSSITKLEHYGTPTVTVTGFTPFAAASSYRRADPHWQWTDSLSWTRGKHTIKFGGNYIHMGDNNANNNNPTGSSAFTNTSQGPTSGYGMADLLLGLPQSTSNSPYAYELFTREIYLGLYVQDDYKVTSRLTINFGLRWDLTTPPVDYGGHGINFNTTTGTPVVQGTQPFFFYQPAGLGDHADFHFDWKDYAPRLGFAWQPFGDGKTVIRGGAGTYYEALSIFTGMSQLFASTPLKYTYTSSLTQPVTLTNPYPSSNALAQSTLSGADMDFKDPRVYQWSFGVQRQLANDMLLDVNYQGSAGNHLQQTSGTSASGAGQNINQPAPGPGTAAQVAARRPYPAYSTIGFTEWGGVSRYESLRASLRKRYGYGLSFLASYTYGKSMDDLNATTNAYNFNTGWGLSGFDVRHRIVLSPVYELPFGPGKPFVSTGIASKILGGWQLSSLFQWQTGAPLTATLAGNYSNSGGTVDRPNVVSNPNANAPHTPQEWFNTAAFVLRPTSGQPGATYSFGNEGIGVITSPGLVDMDLSLVRTFRIRESLRAQFRAEFFNALNHPNFGFPNTVADTSAFGTIVSALDPRESQFSLKILF